VLPNHHCISTVGTSVLAQVVIDRVPLECCRTEAHPHYHHRHQAKKQPQIDSLEKPFCPSSPSRSCSGTFGTPDMTGNGERLRWINNKEEQDTCDPDGCRWVPSILVFNIQTYGMDVDFSGGMSTACKRYGYLMERVGSGKMFVSEFMKLQWAG
jgi:hypothetical protein